MGKVIAGRWRYQAVPADLSVVIRPWEPCDHDAVQRLLWLFAGDAEVAADDAPTFVAVRGSVTIPTTTSSVAAVR